jgi:hypothetical protein
LMALSSERGGDGIRWSNSWHPLTLSYARFVMLAFVVLGNLEGGETIRERDERDKAMVRNDGSPIATQRLIGQHDGRQSARERFRKDNLVSCFGRTGSRLRRLRASAVRIEFVSVRSVASSTACRLPKRTSAINSLSVNGNHERNWSASASNLPAGVGGGADRQVAVERCLTEGSGEFPTTTTTVASTPASGRQPRPTSDEDNSDER